MFHMGVGGAAQVKLPLDFNRKFLAADHIETGMQRPSDPDLERCGTAAFIRLSGFI